MDLLLTNHNFVVSLTRSTGTGRAAPGANELGNGGFQEVTGLEVEMDSTEILEGGRNDSVTRRIGRAKFQPLVCKRGMFRPSEQMADYSLWAWFQDVVAGVVPVPRYSGSVAVYDTRGAKGGERAADEPPDNVEAFVAIWRFERAIPGKIVGPQLNAATGAVAIEELHLHHEGLYLGNKT